MCYLNRKMYDDELYKVSLTQFPTSWFDCRLNLNLGAYRRFEYEITYPILANIRFVYEF